MNLLTRYARFTARTRSTYQRKGGRYTPAPRTATQGLTERKVDAVHTPAPRRDPSHPTAQEIMGSELGKLMPDLAAALARFPYLSASDAIDLMRAADPDAVDALNTTVIM